MFNKRKIIEFEEKVLRLNKKAEALERALRTCAQSAQVMSDFITSKCEVVKVDRGQGTTVWFSGFGGRVTGHRGESAVSGSSSMSIDGQKIGVLQHPETDESYPRPSDSLLHPKWGR